jgi:hypothetical protein
LAIENLGTTSHHAIVKSHHGRSSDPYRRYLPPRASSFPAMGEEKISAAGSAVVSDADIRGLNPCVRELVLRHSGQIEARGRNMFGSVPRRVVAQEENRMSIGSCLGAIGERPKELISVRKAPIKSFHNFLAHFVAASANRGPQRRDQFLRIRTENASHVPYGFLDNPCQRASPPCMDRRHHSPLSVNQQQRQAVSNSDGQ